MWSPAFSERGQAPMTRPKFPQSGKILQMFSKGLHLHLAQGLGERAVLWAGDQVEYQHYISQLSTWANSSHTHPKLHAVLNYVHNFRGVLI